MMTKGFTQSLLASSSKVSQGSISAYVLGKRTPGAEELSKISKALGVSMGWLWGTEETSNMEASSIYLENVKLRAKLDMAVSTLDGALKSLKSQQ